MLGVLPFIEEPDLSGTAGTAVPQHLPPWPRLGVLLLNPLTSDHLSCTTTSWPLPLHIGAHYDYIYIMCNTCVHYHHILVHIAITLYMVMVKISRLGVLLLTPLTTEHLSCTSTSLPLLLHIGEHYHYIYVQYMCALPLHNGAHYHYIIHGNGKNVKTRCAPHSLDQWPPLVLQHHYYYIMVHITITCNTCVHYRHILVHITITL